jgi:hypothetical protein
MENRNKTQEDYWKNKTQWIDSELNSKEVSLTDEEYYRQQDSIREIMELNMVMYGKW